MTNTAVCEWMESKDEKAEKCYVAFEGKKWIKGCAYNETPTYMKKSVDELLSNLKMKKPKNVM